MLGLHASRALRISPIANKLPFRQVLKYKSHKISKKDDVSYRTASPCSYQPSHYKPCFDINSVAVERGTLCNTRMIRSFLYNHYWPREPSVVGLWMDMRSPYLKILTEKYAHSGDRFIAYERLYRTNEKKMIGLLVANRVFPWMIDELKEWARVTAAKPERHRMYFSAHCLKSPNFFKKYNVDYIYDIEILGTSHETAGQGVGVLLLKTALAHAESIRSPLVQVVSVSQYTSRICEMCGMKRDWTMNYSQFVDEAGQCVFFPRRPHHTVGIYVKYFDPKKGLQMPCKPPF